MPTWLTPFFSSIISAGVAFAILYINHLRDKNKAEAGDEKTWRQARTDAEKSLREAINKETQERTHWQLQREGDLAKIADILEENTEAHKLLAGIVARTEAHDGRLNRHDGEFSELRQKLENMHGHIHQLALRYGQPA